MESPNIFDFATGELSQDAFIAWLVTWASVEGGELHDIAKEFIALLYNVAPKGGDIDAHDVGFVEKPILQKVFKIDVFFVAEIKGVKTCFVIEDKVHSSPHSEQLVRYVKGLTESTEYGNLQIAKIYYKTGFISDKDVIGCECDGKPYSYGILNYETIYGFLKSHKTSNLVFESYRTYIYEKFYKVYHNSSKQITDPARLNDLRYSYFQFEYLRQVRDLFGGDHKSHYIDSGDSNGGGKWSTLCITNVDKVYEGDEGDEGIKERIFYLVEKKKKGFCLSVRQYAYIKKLTGETKKIAQSLKLSRLEQYVEAFNLANNKVDGLFDGKKRVDRSGANSSQIGILYFGPNGISKTLEYLPVFQKEFFDELQARGLLTVKKMHQNE